MTDVSHFEKKLKRRLRELDARLTGLEEQLDQPPDPDAEERAIEREGDEILEGLGNAGLVEIRMIQAALRRIEDGTYGECVACGEPIPEARLEAVPHAPRCARCA